MVSANKNISLSSPKLFANPKSFSFILLCILCVYILVLTGCFRLFEVQQDEIDLESVKDEIKEKKIKDKDKKKINDLIDVLKSRSNPKIDEYTSEKGIRYIRYDLEDFIKKEWPKGLKSGARSSQ